MSVEYMRYARTAPTPEETLELSIVDVLASDLKRHLASRASSIASAHVHGAASSQIQLIVAELLRHELGFEEEVVLTPEQGFVTAARPDFIYRLAAGRGVLAEVERGGTVNNNHDLKDLWKTHIAPDAQHLFLIVPNANWTSSGAPRERPFKRVANRLSAFFGDPRREIDVLSLHLFGYGESDHSG